MEDCKELKLDINGAEVWIQEVKQYSMEDEFGNDIIIPGEWVGVEVTFGVGLYSFCTRPDNLHHYLFAINEGEEEFRRISDILDKMNWQ